MPLVRGSPEQGTLEFRGVVPVAAAFVLLADNQLAIVDLESPVLEGVVRLSEAPEAEKLFVGHRIALSADEASLFVLTSGGDGREDGVAVVDARSGDILARWPLDGAVFFKGLAVGPVSGNVYVFGQRGEGELVVLALDPSNGAVTQTWTHDFADGRSWRVLQASILDDEQRVYVSYHGVDTTGVDWFQLDDELTRCQADRKRPNVGCLRGHGGFSCSREGCLVATGSAEILDYPSVEAVDEHAAARTLDTRLGENNHVMEFTVDYGNERMYSLGSCGYTGGLSAVALATGEAEVLSREICGERVVLGPEGTLIVAKLLRPVPSLNAVGSALLVVDSTTGGSVREVSLPANPVDVAVIVR